MRTYFVATLAKLFILILSSSVAILVCEGLARLFLSVRNVGPAFSVHDPVLGKKHKKSFHTTRQAPEFTMTFSTNSFGFRGPEPKVPLPRDALVLLFVGDSFTEGFGVNDGEEFPELIANRLENETEEYPVQVVNAGVGDTGTGRALKFLQLYAKESKSPTVLIYQLSPNDFYDNTRELFYSVDPQGRLIEQNSPVPPSFAQRLQPLVDSFPALSWSYLVAGARDVLAEWGHRFRKFGKPLPEDLHQQELLTFRLVEKLLHTARRKGWPVIGLVFGLPTHWEEGIRTLYDRLGVTAVLLPAKADRADLYYHIDGHWNRKGHAYVAEVLFPVIRKKIKEFRLITGERTERY